MDMIPNHVFCQGNIAYSVNVITIGKKVNRVRQNCYVFSIRRRREKVKEQTGEAEEGKREKAGKSLPACILGFCEISVISMNEDIEDLLLLLQVPEVITYVMTGVWKQWQENLSIRRKENGL